MVTHQDTLLYVTRAKGKAMSEMESSKWENVCVLCAARGHRHRLESGHCCTDHAARLATSIADILRLAADAAAWIAPGSSTGGGARPVPGSKPPCRVDAMDPENTLLPGRDMTVLQCLEEWERMIRDMRGMVAYGPASAGRTAGGMYAGTNATLSGCVTFLGRQVAWIIDAEFPLEDFAGEMHDCVRVLKRWDHEAQDMGTMVKCPTVNEDGSECGYRLHYLAADEHVTCRRCGATRDVAQLVYVAMSDGRDVWLDPEAAASWLGISESTLQRMARRGDVERSHGRYLIRHAAAI